MMTDPTDNSALLDDDDDFGDAMDDEIEDDDDSEFGEMFEEPALVVGIVRGHISDCKRNPQKTYQIILEFKSEEAETRGQTFATFYNTQQGFNQVKFKRIAATLGCEVLKKGKQWGIKGGLSALKNREGLFVVSTWGDKDSPNSQIDSSGIPKSEKSPAWKEWLATNPLNEQQLAVLKKSCGVIPKEHMKLFDSSVSEEDDEL